jgi:hypothetical protein
VGRGRVPEEVVIVDWGSRTVAGRRVEGEGFNIEGLPRASFSSFDPTRYDKGKEVLKISWTPDEILADTCLLLVGLQELKGKKEVQQG